MSKSHILLLMSSALGAMLAVPAQAQEVEEIVVTAQKRSENMQQVPIAISAATGDQLARRNVSEAGDLVRMFPTLSVKQQGPLNNGLSIRGVGTQNLHVTAQPAVGQYLDEVSLVTPFTGKLGLYDLERVEVLRGPQNTLFGRNTTGGAVNYISRKPAIGEATSGYATLGYGRFNLFSAEGAVGVSLSDTVAIRAAGRYEHRDGAFTNLVNGEKLGGYDNYGGRLSLAWEPGTGTKVLLNVHAGYLRSDPNTYRGVGLLGANGVGNCPLLTSGGVAQFVGTNACVVRTKAGLENPSLARWRDVKASRRNVGNIDFKGGLLNVQQDLGDVTVTSITSYDVTKILFQYTFSGTQAFQSSFVQDGSYNIFSQELRIASNGNGPVKWVAGGYYSHEDDDIATIVANNTTPAPFTVVPSIALDQKVNIYSAYAQAVGELTDRLSVTGGIRYTSDRRTGLRTPYSIVGTSTGRVGGTPFGFDDVITIDRVTGLLQGVTTPCATGVSVCAGPGVQLEQSISKVGGKASIDYKFSRDVLGYLSYARGFKSGSFDVRAQAIFLGTAANPVGPETLDAYEAGLKTMLFDRRLQLNGAVYYYDWKGLQAFVSTPAGPSFVNVPKTEIYGAELELKAELSGGWSLNGGVSYTHSEIKDNGGFALVSNGAPVAGTPEWTVIGTLTKTFRLADESEVRLSATNRYTSAQQQDLAAAAFARVDATNMVDVSAAYDFGPSRRYSVSVAADNVTGVKTCSPITNNGQLTGSNGCLPNEGVAMYRANLSVKF